MNQKQFVKAAILSAINSGLSGQAMIDQSVEAVFNGLVDGVCPFGKITPDMTLEAKIKEARPYASVVVKNYLKKDKDLNGGVDYTPANPRGPRQSAELKELGLILDRLISMPQTEATLKMIKDTEYLINLKQEPKKEVFSLEQITALLAKYKAPETEVVVAEEDNSEEPSEEAAG